MTGKAYRKSVTPETDAWPTTFPEADVGDRPEVAGCSQRAITAIERQSIGCGLGSHDSNPAQHTVYLRPNPKPMPVTRVDEQPMVKFFADMLSGLLSAEINVKPMTREAEAARSEALTDALTGPANRRGWEVALAVEEERCPRRPFRSHNASAEQTPLKRSFDNGRIP
jgi:hypothetical protein